MWNRGLGIRMTTIVSPVRFGPLISDNVSLLIKELVRSFLAFAMSLLLHLLRLQQKPINAIRLIHRRYAVFQKNIMYLSYKDENGWSMRSFVIVQTMALRHCGTRNNEGIKLLMYPSLCSF